MKKKVCISLLAGILSVSLLSGCDLSVLKPPGMQTSSAQPEEQTEAESLILEYEARLASGEATEEDYMTLAQMYADEGRVRDQRDTLELCWRVLGTQDSFAALQQITVNAAEENETLQQEINTLYQNVTTPELIDEAVAMFTSQEWFQIAMPKLKEGCRSYYLSTEAGDTLHLQVGYGESGQQYSKVWYTDSENQLTYVRYESGTAQVMKTSVADGVCTGAFDSWTCDSAGGAVFHETGTFENGICIGAYHADVAFPEPSEDAFTFWQSRNVLDLTAYNGDFGTDGVTTVEQPAADSRSVTNGNGDASYIVYAYDESKTNYLFVVAETEDVSSVVFDGAMFGLDTEPAFTPYEPNPDAAAAEPAADLSVKAADIQVRVYDGEIQWFDGKTWHSEGSVAEYEAKDPLAAYAGRSEAAAEGGQDVGEDQGDGTEGQPAVSSRRGGGKIEAPKKATESNSTGSSSNGSGSGGSSGGGSSSGGSSGGSGGGGDDYIPPDETPDTTTEPPAAQEPEVDAGSWGPAQL